MEKKLSEEIVKGKVAEYAVDVAKLNNVSHAKLAEILREIAEQL